MSELNNENPFDKFVLFWVGSFALLLFLSLLIYYGLGSYSSNEYFDRPFVVYLVRDFVLSFVAAGFFKWLFWAIEFRKNQKTKQAEEEIINK